MTIEQLTPETVATMPALPVVTKPEGSRIPLKSWAVDVEDGALEQAANLTRLSVASSHVALMPDAHPGYGMPIGGVLFTDHAVVPYAVGVDIGCGVSLIRTSLELSGLDNAMLQEILDAVADRVPVGNGPLGGHALSDVIPEYVTPDGVSSAADKAFNQGYFQLGTLGGGNHFIEVQVVDGDPSLGEIVVMIHSGSRSVGKKICDHWHKVALSLCQRWHTPLPDKDLAFLPLDSDEGRRYMVDMNAALKWAAANRVAMGQAVGDAIASVVPDSTTETILDVHHNYAAVENHFGRNGVVHRKGAVRAREGEVVLIPGSMGTRSYVGEGLGNVDSFQSCQHGAGRARSRKATMREETEAEFRASVAHVRLGGKASEARDESPFAYKDVDRVMAASRDLVRATATLRPLGVVKG